MARRPTPTVIAQRLQLAIWRAAIPDVPPAPDFYLKTYVDYVDRFAAVTRACTWTEGRVVDFVRLVYTWMKRATKCDIDRTVARQLALELNDGTNEERLIHLASRLVNNSMVGGSKFLHFYAPERFPITDSWLQRLSGKPGRGYELDYYRDYFSGLLLVDAVHREKALVWARAFFGYEVSSVRAIEAVAFYLLKSGWHHDLHATPANTRAARHPCRRSAAQPDA
jgi:hypothetical protein